MAAFFPPHQPPDHSTRQPIKLSGFAIPSSSNTSSTSHSSSSTVPPTSQYLSGGGGHSSIDPSILFGLTGHHHSSPSNGWSQGFGGSSSNGGMGGFGSSSVLTETDLDIENMLASFSQHHHQQNGNGPHSSNNGNPNAEHHFFGSQGAGGGSNGGNGNDPAGSNGFLGTATMNYNTNQQAPQLQSRTGSISATNQGQNSPHSFFANSPSASSQPPSHSHPHPHPHPPSSAASIPHFARSPSIASSTISAADFFPTPSLPFNSKDSPLGQGTSTDPSSYTSDTFSPPSSKRSPPTQSTREGRSSSKGKDGSSERTGSRSRSIATAGVGKAPRTTSRSRSARRNSTAAGYQDRPSPGGNERSSSSTATAAASSNTTTSNPATGSHGSAAIIIPSSTAGPLPSPSLQYSMSMPAYPSASTSGAPGLVPSLAGGWFSQAGLSFLPTSSQQQSHPLSPQPPTLGPLPGQADPVSGWRPSSAIVMPASAPAASSGLTKPPKVKSVGNASTAESGSSSTCATSSKGKKNQARDQLLEDVQEEEGDEKTSTSADPATEKRRKRRESHNLVERRRRDNINDRITELSALLPEAFMNTNAPPTIPRRSSSISNQGDAVGENGGSPTGLGVGNLSLMSPPPPVGLALFGTSPVSGGGGGGGAGLMAAAAAANQAAATAANAKPNKGMVLAKSVEYIRFLMETLELQSQQILELQRQNQQLQQHSTQTSFPSHPHTENHHADYHASIQQLQVPTRSASGSAQSGEWAAFEDEDIGGNHNHDRRYKEEGGDEDDEGMDET